MTGVTGVTDGSIYKGTFCAFIIVLSLLKLQQYPCKIWNFTVITARAEIFFKPFNGHEDFEKNFRLRVVVPLETKGLLFLYFRNIQCVSENNACTLLQLISIKL